MKIEEEASVEGFYAGCVSFQPEVQPLPPLPLSLNRFDVLDNEPAEMELPEPRPRDVSLSTEKLRKILPERHLRTVEEVVSRI